MKNFFTEMDFVSSSSLKLLIEMNKIADNISEILETQEFTKLETDNIIKDTSDLKCEICYNKTQLVYETINILYHKLKKLNETL